MEGYSNIINALFTDSKCILRSYLAFKKNRNEIKKIAFSFEEIPFSGNFSILAGIDELINFLSNFKFYDDNLLFLQEKFPNFDSDYFEFLKNIDMNEICLSGLDNGSEYFAKEKILTLSGKFPVILLLIYAISNIISFSTLICTNSVRMRKIAGENVLLLEFGLRRAQGPMAGNFASKYSYLGSFGSISNCLAGMYYDIPVSGTCAHAYIMSFQNQKLHDEYLLDDDIEKNIYKKALELRHELDWNTNLDELKAFCSFARIYKEKSLLLVDTYNTIHSGVKNTILVSLSLHYYYQGLNVKGVRLDSGDLAELSKKSIFLADEISEKYKNEGLKLLKISASNDINEKSLKQFNQQGHSLHILGIGTNLVTCQLQPFCYVKSQILNKEFNQAIYDCIKNENEVKFLQKRLVLSSLTNSEEEFKKRIEQYKNIYVNDSKTTLEEQSKYLFIEGKSFNEKNLAISKDRASKNYYKIIHLIKLDSKEVSHQNFEMKNMEL